MNTPSLANVTAEVVAAFVSKNKIPVQDLPALIASTAASIRGLNGSAVVIAAPAPQEPAISIRRSITEDYIVCLEDGKRLKSLKRYLRSRFGLSPDEYRAKWGLPADYPMVAPSYSKVRSNLAKQMGLGAKGATTEDQPVTDVADEIPSALADEGIPASVLERDEVVTDTTGAVVEEGPTEVEAAPAEAPAKTDTFQDDDEAAEGSTVTADAGPGKLPEGYTDATETFVKDGDKVTGIICLIDNKTVRDLGRHARRHHSVNADQYRAMYGLPGDYPMTIEAAEAFLSKQAS